MYPKILPDHFRKEYSHNDYFSKDIKTYTRSYFHKTSMAGPIGMHSHKFYEINIIVDGKGHHYIENQICDARAGCVFIIPPNIRHGYYEEEGANLNIFHTLLSFAFFEQYSEEIKNLPGYAILFEIEPYLRSEFDGELFLTMSDEQLNLIMPDLTTLASYEKSEYAGISVLKNIRTLALIGALSKMISSSHHKKRISHTDRNSLPVISVMEYIRMNYFEKISVNDLAKMANMSRSAFLRHFENLCRCTPSQYLTSCRIHSAKNLLASSDATITEIAQKCGFYDSSHFIRLFLKSENISPVQFRKNVTESM